MRKIKLSIERLRVESFATAATERGQGTIFGNAKTLAYDTCAAGAPCFSAIDTCPSSPHAATLPCNGCVDTELCVGTELCVDTELCAP
ncbi:MAG: hypothetical protein ACJ8J0_22740 [Longimicrobiaceae bacterium]